VFIFELLEPTKSIRWPDQHWEVPKDLQNWLTNNMHVPFQPANMAAVNVESSSTQEINSLLSKTYENKPSQSRQPIKKTKNLSKKSQSLSAPSSLILGIGNQDAEEDFGTPVVTVVKSNSKKRKKAKKKKITSGTKK